MSSNVETGIRLGLVIVLGALAGGLAGAGVAWLAWLLMWAPYSTGR